MCISSYLLILHVSCLTVVFVGEERMRIEGNRITYLQEIIQWDTLLIPEGIFLLSFIYDAQWWLGLKVMSSLLENWLTKITSGSCCLQYTLWQMCWLSKEWFSTHPLWQVQMKTRVGICCLASVFYLFSVGDDTKLQMDPSAVPLAFNRRNMNTLLNKR